MAVQAGTQVTVSQQVTRLDSGGKATAVEVSQITGNVTISSYNYSYRNTSATVKPPRIETICAYLVAASQPDQPEESMSQGERELWGIAYSAHPANQEEPEGLYSLVKRIFNDHQMHGGFQRVVLLADAGVGKTPALYQLRQERAKETLQQIQDQDNSQTAGDDASAPKTLVIPIFIKLAELTPDQPLTALIQGSFNRYLQPDGKTDRITSEETAGLLEKFSCMFLFDDLEELLSIGKLGGFQALSHFMEVYGHQHQYVISCRTGRYRQQLGVLDTLYLDNLMDQEVIPIVGEEAYAKLSPYSRELAHNRKILALYIQLGRSSDLLQTSGRLAQMYIRHKIKTYREIQSAHSLNPVFLEDVLEQLALHLRSNRNRCMSERELMGFIVGYLKDWQENLYWRDVIEELQTADFIVYDSEMRWWRFCDSSDDAFFSASALIHNPAMLESVLGDVSDYWWRDVFELLVGLHPKPRDLLLELTDRDVLVAANCIRFVGESVGTSVEEALIDALDERLKLESSTRRKYIIERIGESSHPRAGEALLRAIHREWSSTVLMSAVKSLVTWNKRTGRPVIQAERRVLHSLSGPVESISEVIKLYSQGNPDQGAVKKIVEIIHSPAVASKTKGLAAIGLGLVGTEEAMEALCNLLDEGQNDDFLAWCLVEALTQYNHPKVYEFVVRKLYHKESRAKHLSHQRARAIYLLGWVGQGVDQHILTALRDKNFFVRGYAIETMARRDLVGARQLIEKILTSETDPFVLRKAAEALGRIGTLDSIPVLEQNLFQENARSRWAIRQAIAEIKERNSMGGFRLVY